MLNYDLVQLSVSVNLLNIITTMIVSSQGQFFRRPLSGQAWLSVTDW